MWNILLLIFFAAGRKRLRNTTINGLESLKYILRLRICQSWEYRMKFGISIFRYYRRYFRYRNIEYNISTDIDTERMIPNDFFGIFELPAPTRNLHHIHMSQSDRGIHHHTNDAWQVLPLRLCRLEIAVNCSDTQSFCLHFHHWRIDPSNTGKKAQKC